MNVLLITFSFPPAGGVGVLRALSLAKYLPDSDLRVDVLTARNAPSVGRDPSLLQQVPGSVTIHRSWTLDLPFTLRKGIKKLVSGRKPPSAAAVALPASNGAAPRVNPVKRLVGDLLLPDPQVGWLPFAFPAARRIIRDRSIDLVLITVPPFSTVLLVSRLRKAFPHLPIVLDFRDEWLSTTINLVSFNNNQRARSIAQQAESNAVRDANAVVAVTEAARFELLTRYPNEDAGKFRCIPNGFDSTPAAASPTRPPSDTIVLTYIGTVYGSTDPANFVEAVLGLPDTLRSRLRVRYIGHIETAAYRESLLRLGDTVELRGFMPQREALAAIADTDYLLLITHDRINVAAKFYDYLAGGKPIFAAVHPTGDVRKLLEETGAGRWADINDVAAIRQLLAAILTPQAPAGAPTRQPDRIARYHRRELARRYALLLRELSPVRR